MSVIRVNKTKDYTIMSNYHFKEKEMSLKAKGLLSLMLSLPEDWDYSIAGLVAICKENETAIKSTLDELKEFGYLQVIKHMPTKENGGRIEYEYIVYEQKQEGKKQGVENLGVEILSVENPIQLNTNNKITNKLNTNNKYIVVLEYLNEKTGANFRPIDTNLKLIKARMQDYTEQDLKNVIDKKVKEWKGTEMQQYLRPKTLFNATNFENYVNSLENLSTNKNNFIHNNYTNQQISGLISDLDNTEV